MTYLAPILICPEGAEGGSKEPPFFIMDAELVSASVFNLVCHCRRECIFLASAVSIIL
jgi:hypothetical protein